MRKTLTIILVLFIVTAAAYIGLNIYSRNTKKRPPYKNDMEREEYIENFVKQGNIPTDEGIHGVEGSQDDIVSIQGKDVLVEYIGIDETLKFEEKINASIKGIYLINSDLKNPTDEAVEQYFKKNKNIIIDLYGIDSITQFKKFFKKIYTYKDDIIKSAALKNIVKIGNIIDFELSMQTNRGGTSVYQIRLIQTNIKTQENRTEYMLYFKIQE